LAGAAAKCPPESLDAARCRCRGQFSHRNAAEQSQATVSGRWHAFTSNWRELTRYNPPFHLPVSARFHQQTKMEQNNKQMERLPLHAEDEERIAKLATEIKRDEFFFAFALVWLAAWIVMLLYAIFA
jgi:hypothetical protein